MYTDRDFLTFIEQILQNNEFIIKVTDLSKGIKFAKYIAYISAGLEVSDLFTQDQHFMHDSPMILEMAINELIINAIEHGVLGIHYEKKEQLLASQDWHTYIAEQLSKLNKSCSKEQAITISCKLDRNSNTMEVSISDPGKGFDMYRYKKQLEEAMKKSSLLSYNGRGIILVNSVLARNNLQYFED